MIFLFRWRWFVVVGGHLQAVGIMVPLVSLTERPGGGFGKRIEPCDEVWIAHLCEEEEEGLDRALV